MLEWKGILFKSCTPEPYSGISCIRYIHGKVDPNSHFHVKFGVAGGAHLSVAELLSFLLQYIKLSSFILSSFQKFHWFLLCCLSRDDFWRFLASSSSCIDEVLGLVCLRGSDISQTWKAEEDENKWVVWYLFFSVFMFF